MHLAPLHHTRLHSEQEDKLQRNQQTVYSIRCAGINSTLLNSRMKKSALKMKLEPTSPVEYMDGGVLLGWA
ncbi:hypothetical protein OH492_14500 [Vibrio chagasii]|nr:hypothetical protein [Vibrio chagasii]